MSQTNYNIEILFPNTKKWQYVNQTSTLHWAMVYANGAYTMNAAKMVRIRKVVKTIVWKGKGNAKATEPHS